MYQSEVDALVQSAPGSSMQQEPTSSVWLQCLQKLKLSLPAKQVQTWLEPLQAHWDADTRVLRLEVASRFKLEYIRSQYGLLILQTLQQISSSDSSANALNSQLLFTLAARNKAVPRSAKAASLLQIATTTHEQSQQAELNKITPSEPLVFDAREDPAKQHSSRLNKDLNFDTLVEGSANRMARAAGLHVATQSGHGYNPLFIYGASGLGKTHLLHAIGNRFLQENPKAQVLHVHAEKFISDVVQAYQRKTFDRLKSYYHSLDLLLIDDVQMLAGKERTQDEFFNTFEALLHKKSRIVMTSDTFPKALANINERLITRFASGLTVVIDPPELEMRVAILLSKAQHDAIHLDEDVAFFIAKNVRSNVRELEGALRMVIAYTKFTHKAISIETAREALRDLLSVHHRQITVENIQKTVADFFKIKMADMHSKRRPANIAKPRQIAMYLAKELTQKSLPEIGELFGGRDHTTVLHAVKKINAERVRDVELNQQLHVLEQTLKG